MKTIVFIGKSKHSAWFTPGEAAHQVEVLEDHGYKNVYWTFVDHNYENGQYFV